MHLKLGEVKARRGDLAKAAEELRAALDAAVASQGEDGRQSVAARALLDKLERLIVE